MATPQQDEGVVRLPRVSIDFKIPLWGIMGSASVMLIGLASMYFQLMRVADDVAEMKAWTRANTATTLEFAKEQARMQVRLERLEQDRR